MNEDKIDRLFTVTEKVLTVVLIVCFAVWMFHHFIHPIV